jgi:signal transduction histidine kinase
MMVKRGVGGPVTGSQVELLSIAYQGSQTMLELVNNLLDISKMEQGSMHLDLEPVAPYAIIDHAIDRLQVSARKRVFAHAVRLPLHRVQAQNRWLTVIPCVSDEPTFTGERGNLADEALAIGSLVLEGTPATLFADLQRLRRSGPRPPNRRVAIHPPLRCFRLRGAR